MAICFQSPIKPVTIPQPQSLPKPNLCCNLSLPSRWPIADPDLVYASVRTFAPATEGNLGPGFDFLSCAVDGLGDFVSLTVDPKVRPGEVAIAGITGDHAAKLSCDPLWNCAGIATIEVVTASNPSAQRPRVQRRECRGGGKRDLRLEAKLRAFGYFQLRHNFPIVPKNFFFVF